MSEIDYLNLEFSKALVDVVKKMRKKMDEVLKKFGLTHFHALYVLELFKSGELTMGELTENIGVDKANTSLLKICLKKDMQKRLAKRIENLQLNCLVLAKKWRKILKIE